MTPRAYRPPEWDIGFTHAQFVSRFDVTLFADLDGTAGDDVLRGTDDADVINGLSGNDDLKGGGGDDVIHGGADNDYINGNDGNDTLYGDSGDNEIHGGIGDDIIYCGNGRDTVYGGPGNNTINGGTTRTSLYTLFESIDIVDHVGTWNVDYSSDVIGLTVINYGGAGDYATVFSNGSKAGYAEHLNFVFGAGDDSLTAHRLAGFSVDAGEGSDNLKLDNNGKNYRLSLISLDDGSFELATGYRTNTRLSLYQNFESFEIDAGRRNGKIYIDGSTLLTGARLDLTAIRATLDFSNATQIVDFQVDSSRVGHLNGSNFVISTYTIILNDLGGRVVAAGYLHGGAGNDFISVGGFSYYSVLTGNGGDDSLTGAGNIDTMSGGDGDDIITGNGGDDTITGDAGGDTIDGGDGNDTIDGGSDNDIVTGSAGIDRLTGGLGDNAINGGDGDDVIVSAVGAVDTVDGGADHDLWSGDYSARQDGIMLNWGGSLQISDGTNVINVEQVSLVLGRGDDYLAVTAKSGNALIVAAGAGSDTIDFSLAGGAITLSLAQTGIQNTGGGGSEKIAGFENVVGSAYKDSLSGNEGANILTGGEGADVLTGAGGADRFVFTSLADLGSSSNVDKIDRITDFAHFERDRLDLSAIDADPNTDGDQAFKFIGAEPFEVGGTARGELRYSQSVDGYLLVQGDLNHDGMADFSFLVRGTALVASDLVL